MDHSVDRRLQSALFLVILTNVFFNLVDVESKERYYVTGADMIAVTCANGDGWYRNPFDCSKFYACVDTGYNKTAFFIQEDDCPEGLYYDANRTMCTYPFEARPPCDVEPATTTRRSVRIPPRPVEEP